MSRKDNNRVEATDSESVKISLMRRVLGSGKQLALFMLLAMAFTGVMDIWRGKDIPRDNLPDIKGITLAGTDIDIKAMSQDQPVLVYFWGTWCPVCNFVSPAVDTMASIYPVVSVAMNSGPDDKMSKYLAHKGYEFDTINDSNNEIARDWSVQLTPTLMVFKDGELKHYTTGFTSLPGMWWRMLLS